MCLLTKDGYKMLDGTLIPFDFKISEISTQHIKELSNCQASVWDLLAIRSSFTGMKNELISALESHQNNCVIGLTGKKGEDIIRNVVRQEIKSLPVKAFRTTSSLAKDLTVIITLILAILNFVGIIGK